MWCFAPCSLRLTVHLNAEIVKCCNLPSHYPNLVKYKGSTQRIPIGVDKSPNAYDVWPPILSTHQVKLSQHKLFYYSLVSRTINWLLCILVIITESLCKVTIESILSAILFWVTKIEKCKAVSDEKLKCWLNLPTYFSHRPNLAI